MADTISNIRWFPETREIGEIFVDRESAPICRTEARWRLEGEKRTPELLLARDERLRRQAGLGRLGRQALSGGSARP